MYIAYVTTTFRFDIDHVCENKISGRKALLSRNGYPLYWFQVVLVRPVSPVQVEPGVVRQVDNRNTNGWLGLPCLPISHLIQNKSKNDLK